MAFKDGFSKLTKSLGESASNVVQKSNKLMEITKLHSEIDGAEKKKNVLYLEIGKLVYNSHVNKEDSSEEIKNKCEAISLHDEVIAKIKGQILDIKKVKLCSKCGVEINADITFCPNCGSSQEIIADKTPVDPLI